LLVELLKEVHPLNVVLDYEDVLQTELELFSLNPQLVVQDEVLGYLLFRFALGAEEPIVVGPIVVHLGAQSKILRQHCFNPSL
jgi:hypothetical protein